jgi:transcriptional regulator with XRE-family HTH domain
MTITDYYTASDSQVLRELGGRLRALRLSRNMTQEELAERALLSRSTIKSLEKGHGKLANVVAVLRELEALQQLDQFIPPVGISPLQMAEASVKAPHARVRASARTAPKASS